MSLNDGKTPRQKALESRTKPAVVHYPDGGEVYCTFAEVRGSCIYIQAVRYEDDDDVVGEYIPLDKIDSMTRLNGGN